MKKNAGFTLIEVIVVLVLVGILSALAGMGIVTGLKGYLFAKENAPMAQKAEMAMSRLSREFLEIVKVTTAGVDSIVFQDITGNSRAVKKIGSEIKMIDGTTLPDADTGNVLIDKVSGFNLTYNYNNGTSNSAWVVGNPVNQLTTITITLTVNRPDSGIGDIVFSTDVNPRNTGVANVPIK